jgi:hypothetical protein
MRSIPFAAITFAALSLSTIGARADGTWCAQYSNHGGGTDCGFYSFEQCRATVSGIGGFCMRNPFSPYRNPGWKNLKLRYVKDSWLPRVLPLL